MPLLPLIPSCARPLCPCPPPGCLARRVVASHGLSGPIPESLGQIHRLEELFLRGNRLTGEIPPSLGNLKSLRKLFLNSNDLVGPVPHELGMLSSLDTLNLSWNNLHGEVPASIRALVRQKETKRERIGIYREPTCRRVFFPTLQTVCHRRLQLDLYFVACYCFSGTSVCTDSPSSAWLQRFPIPTLVPCCVLCSVTWSSCRIIYRCCPSRETSSLCYRRITTADR